MTNTDPGATGREISWGCVCSDGPGTSRACPFCAVVAQKAFNARTWGCGDSLPDELPLFPTTGGGAPAKDKCVGNIEEMAKLCEQPLFGQDGTRQYGGHSWSVTGAQHLARTGVALVAIMSLAWWASATALRYIGNAPVNCVTPE